MADTRIIHPLPCVFDGAACKVPRNYPGQGGRRRLEVFANGGFPRRGPSWLSIGSPYRKRTAIQIRRIAGTSQQGCRRSACRAYGAGGHESGAIPGHSRALKSFRVIVRSPWRAPGICRCGSPAPRRSGASISVGARKTLVLPAPDHFVEFVSIGGRLDPLPAFIADDERAGAAVDVFELDIRAFTFCRRMAFIERSEIPILQLGVPGIC